MIPLTVVGWKMTTFTWSTLLLTNVIKDLFANSFAKRLLLNEVHADPARSQT